MNSTHETTPLTDDQRRLKRIETYLFLLCKHLGLNPATGERIAGDMSKPNSISKGFER